MTTEVNTEQEILNLQQQYFEAEMAQDQAKVKEIEEKINLVLDKTPLGGYTEEQTEVSDPSQPPAQSTEIPEGSTEQVEAKAGEESATPVTNSEVVVENKEAVQDKEVQATATENWIESLDPKIRENVEKLLRDNQQLVHRIKSDDGRVRAINTHLDTARKETAKYKEELETLKKASPQSSKTPAAEDDPNMRKLKEEDEGLYNVLSAREQKLMEHIKKLEEKLDSSVKPLQTTQERYVQEREQEYLTKELDQLCQYHPNAIEILNHPAWEKFYQESPPGVKALADSHDHRDLLEAFRIYGSWAQEINRLSEQYGKNDPTSDKYDPLAKVKQQQPDPRAAAVEAERKRKLDSQPVVSQAVKPPVTKKPSEAEIFSNPELLLKEQQRIMAEELKKLGLG